MERRRENGVADKDGRLARLWRRWAARPYLYRGRSCTAESRARADSILVQAVNPMTRRQALGALGALALPWEQMLAQAAPAPAKGNGVGAMAGEALPPDLTNLHPIIQSIADQRSTRLSFLDAQWRELDAWKQAARAEFHRCLSYDPKPRPLRSELINREEREGFSL